MLPNQGHKGCFHCTIQPGIVYCLENRTVFVNTDNRLAEVRIKPEEGLHALSFIQACAVAKKSLPSGSIMAYVWLHTALKLPGFGLPAHTVAELETEIKKRAKLP